MTNLYPPVLDSKAYSIPFVAQVGQGTATSNFYDLIFALPSMVSESSIKHLQVVIKYQSTGEPAVNTLLSPDRATLFIKALEAEETQISATNIYWQKYDDSGNYRLRIPYWAFADGKPKAGTTYSVQVRFGGNVLWGSAGTGLDGTGFSNFAAWRQNAVTTVPSMFGEWSNIQTVFCYDSYSAYFDYNFDDFMPEIVWQYSPRSDDPIQQVSLTYVYQDFEGTQYGNQVFNGQYNGDSSFTLRAEIPIAPLFSITGTVEAITKNNTLITTDFIINPIRANEDATSIEYGVVYPVLKGKVQEYTLQSEEINDGIIAMEMSITENATEGTTFNLYRVNLLSFDTIRVAEGLTVTRAEKQIVKDYTVEMGEDYQYIGCAMDSQGKMSAFLMSPFPYGYDNSACARLMFMGAAYLTTCKHQLRLQGNVSVSSFKRNTQDQFQTTLGSKYPFYSRVAQNNYRSLQVSALISINFDPTSSFLRLDPDNGLYWDEKAALSEDSVYNSTKKQYQESKDQCTKAYMEIAAERDQYIKDNVKEHEYETDPDYKRKVDEYLYETYDQRLEVLSTQITEYSTIINRGPSYLKIQDRDIYSQEQIALTRRRMQYRGAEDNEYIEQTYTEETQLTDEQRRKLGIRMGPKTIFDKNLLKNVSLQYGTDKTDSLVFVERKFRELVMDWLSDAKPKLFRSETEGNMIVMVSSPSFTPYDKSGRMVYTMSCTLTEVAEYNLENLKLYDLIPSQIESVYIPGNEYAYTPGDEDPNVNTSLIYQYSSDFDIPDSQTNVPIKDINTYSAVLNGSPPYTFEKVNLPAGIDIDPEKGIISGTPTTPRSKGTGTVKVTDKLKQTAQMVISIGEIYNQLIFNQITDVIPGGFIGEQIDSFSVMDKISGGVPSYQFFATNLPLGIVIDRLTGTISGAYAADVQSGQAIITVMDSVGNRADQVLNFGEGVMPLTFQSNSAYNMSYTEVETKITEIDVTPSVSGGYPDFEQSVSGYKFSLSGQPDGIVIDEFKGIISGTPTASRSAGTMTVTVEDFGNPVNTASISITYLRVLDKFVFDHSDSFDIIKKEGEMVDIPVGYKIAEIDIMAGDIPAVRGGLQYSTGNPYRFESVKLRPNFEISNAGIISGTASTAQEPTTATLTAVDARGKKVSCKIQISRITGALSIQPNANVYKLPDAIINEGAASGGEYGFSIPMSEVKGGTAPYTFSLTGFPTGVTIEVQQINGVDYAVVGGIPTSYEEPKTGYITVYDSNTPKSSFSLPVEIGGVYDKVAWNPVNDLDIPAKNIGESYSGPTFDGVTGGKKPYTFSSTELDQYGYSISNGISVDTEVNTRITGIAKDKVDEKIIELKVTDALGYSAVVKITVGKTIEGLSLKSMNSMQNYEFVQGVTTIPDGELQILQAEGGTSPYTYRLKNGQKTFAGGFSLSEKGFIYGTPNIVYSSTELSVLFEVVDADGNTASCSTTWYSPAVRQPFSVLKSDPWNEGWLRKNIDLSSTSVYGKTFGPYFNDGGSKGIQLEATNLPSGITFGADYILRGTPTTATNNQITSVLKITRPESEYTPEQTAQLTVVFEGISGDMTYSILPPGLSLPKMALNQEITPVVISNGLSGGQQPFVWSITGLPSGLTYDYPGTGEVCTISGAPTEIWDSSIQVVITVTDNTGKSIVQSIPQGGVYEPIIFNPITVSIPSVESGATIDEIDISSFVTGGTPKYEFSSPDLKSSYGYDLSNDGKISGSALSEISVPAGTATIQVSDSNGLTATQTIQVGEIKGPVTFRGSDTIQVEAGKVGTQVNEVDVKSGVSGGQEPYTFSFSTLDIPSTWNGCLTIDSSTGKITGKRPAVATAATTLKVIISDSSGGSTSATIPLGEVTE